MTLKLKDNRSITDLILSRYQKILILKKSFPHYIYLRELKMMLILMRRKINYLDVYAELMKCVDAIKGFKGLIDFE